LQLQLTSKCFSKQLLLFSITKSLSLASDLSSHFCTSYHFSDAAVITSPLGNAMAKLHSTAQFQVNLLIFVRVHRLHAFA